MQLEIRAPNKGGQKTIIGRTPTPTPKGAATLRGSTGSTRTRDSHFREVNLIPPGQRKSPKLFTQDSTLGTLTLCIGCIGIRVGY